MRENPTRPWNMFCGLIQYTVRPTNRNHAQEAWPQLRGPAREAKGVAEFRQKCLNNKSDLLTYLICLLT